MRSRCMTRDVRLIAHIPMLAAQTLVLLFLPATQPSPIERPATTVTPSNDVDSEVRELLASGSDTHDFAGDSYASKCGKQKQKLEPNPKLQSKQLGKIAKHASAFVNIAPVRNENKLLEEEQARRDSYQKAYYGTYYASVIGTATGDISGAIMDVMKAGKVVSNTFEKISGAIPGIGGVLVGLMGIVQCIFEFMPKDEDVDPHLECMDLLRTEVQRGPPYNARVPASRTTHASPLHIFSSSPTPPSVCAPARCTRRWLPPRVRRLSPC